MEYGSCITGSEYETQFFGFTPKSFVDGVYNAVSDYVSDCFVELEKHLKNEPTLSGGCTPEQIHKSTAAMLSNFYKHVDDAFDRFDLYMRREIFVIPPNVLLPEDEAHRGKNYTEEDEQQIDEEINELLQKIKAAKYVNTALKQEVKELDAMESQMAECEKYLNTLEKACSTALGLKECLEFTCDQANKLHDLLKTGLDNNTMPVQEQEKDVWRSPRKKIKIG